MMTAVARTLAILDLIERLIALAAFAVMTLILIADVAYRELTGTGIAGAPKIAVYAFITCALISIGLASSADIHLRPQFADRLLPERFAPVLDRAQEATMAVFCAIFAVAAADMVMETYRLEELSPTLWIALWPFQLAFPIAFAIAAFRHGAYTIFPLLRPADAQESAEEFPDETPVAETAARPAPDGVRAR